MGEVPLFGDMASSLPASYFSLLTSLCLRMNFWDQFWPQFWGGIASGLALALLTALITFLSRKRILRAVKRHISPVENISKSE